MFALFVISAVFLFISYGINLFWHDIELYQINQDSLIYNYLKLFNQVILIKSAIVFGIALAWDIFTIFA